SRDWSSDVCSSDLEGDKKYLENEKELQKNKATYIAQENERIKSAKNKTNDAHHLANRQKKEMTKYQEENEPRYEKKVEDLYVYENELQENRWIMQEQALEKRMKNNQELIEQQQQIQNNQKQYENRRKDREIDVKQYKVDVAEL